MQWQIPPQWGNLSLLLTPQSLFRRQHRMMTEMNITLLEAMNEQVESVFAINLLAWDHQD
jgi:hypothetical protein